MPVVRSEKFKCPHCGVVSQQRWFGSDLYGRVANEIADNVYYSLRKEIQTYEQSSIENFLVKLKPSNLKGLEGFIPKNLSIGTCNTCSEITLWISKEIVYPKKTAISEPNKDLDSDIRELYYEAASIFSDSPKGATALLRLCLQKLLKQIGKSGLNINSDIKELVASGLSPKIQQALDLVRVVGNNAVHPGQIDLNDGSDIALKLFHLLNFIADELISKPKELDLLYTEVIPEETKLHINQRDGT